MQFLIKPTEPEKLETDVLIFFCFQDSLVSLSYLDNKVSGLLNISAAKENFSGMAEQILTFSSKTHLASYKVMVVGLGKEEEFELSKLQNSLALAIKEIRSMKSQTIGIVTNELSVKKYSISEIVQNLVETIIFAAYRFEKYQSQAKIEPAKLNQVIINIKPSHLSQGFDGCQKGQIIAKAVCFARDLVNEPAAVTTPSFLAQTAVNIAKTSKGAVKVRIFEREEIEKLGLGAYLGVAKGSEEPPKFIRLSYKPARFDKSIIIAGKGITFDTGGLSLKSGEQMETMKSDMAGAASVLGIFQALTNMKVNHQVIGLIPSCENMPSGRSLRPGDIVKALNGKTIEVLNTDAEGRLTLADAFSYALKYEKPDYLLDLATLTGACKAALGEEIAGLWGNNQKLIDLIKEASIATGEKLWHMPLFEEYRKLIKSNIADLKNIQTGKFGQAVTAALFLSEFVKDTPWAHMDIAGPAFAEKDTPLTTYGGTGFGIRMLLHFLENL